MPSWAFLVPFMLAAPSLEGLDPTDRHVIESIELDAQGRSGTLKTQPLHLDGSPRSFRFGSGPCSKYAVQPVVMDALLVALRTQQPVRVNGVEVRGALCVASVVFFAQP